MWVLKLFLGQILLLLRKELSTVGQQLRDEPGSARKEIFIYLAKYASTEALLFPPKCLPSPQKCRPPAHKAKTKPLLFPYSTGCMGLSALRGLVLLSSLHTLAAPHPQQAEEQERGNEGTAIFTLLSATRPAGLASLPRSWRYSVQSSRLLHGLFYRADSLISSAT